MSKFTSNPISKVTSHAGFARLHFSDGTTLIVTTKDGDHAAWRLANNAVAPDSMMTDPEANR